MNSELINKMTAEQRQELSRQGNRARELIRLSNEPPGYAPINPARFQRFAIIGDLSFSKPRIVTGLFFDCGHVGRYEMMVNAREGGCETGWYNGLRELARRIPPPRRME